MKTPIAPIRPAPLPTALGRRVFTLGDSIAEAMNASAFKGSGGQIQGAQKAGATFNKTKAMKGLAGDPDTLGEPTMLGDYIDSVYFWGIAANGSQIYAWYSPSYWAAFWQEVHAKYGNQFSESDYVTNAFLVDPTYGQWSPIPRSQWGAKIAKTITPLQQGQKLVATSSSVTLSSWPTHFNFQKLHGDPDTLGYIKPGQGTTAAASNNKMKAPKGGFGSHGPAPAGPVTEPSSWWTTEQLYAAQAYARSIGGTGEILVDTAAYSSFIDGAWQTFPAKEGILLVPGQPISVLSGAPGKGTAPPAGHLVLGGRLEEGRVTRVLAIVDNKSTIITKAQAAQYACDNAGACRPARVQTRLLHGTPDTLGDVYQPGTYGDPVMQAVQQYLGQYGLPSMPGLSIDPTSIANIAATLLRGGLAGQAPVSSLDPSWFQAAAQAATAWIAAYGTNPGGGMIPAIPGLDPAQISSQAANMAQFLLGLTKAWPAGAPPLPAPPSGVSSQAWLSAIVNGATLLLSQILPAINGAMPDVTDAATAIQAMQAAAALLRSYVQGAAPPLTTPNTPPPIQNCGTPGYVVDPTTGNCVPSGNQPPHIGPVPGPCPNGAQPDANGNCPAPSGGSTTVSQSQCEAGGGVYVNGTCYPSGVSPTPPPAASKSAAASSSNATAWVVGGGLAAVALAGIAISMKKRRKAA